MAHHNVLFPKHFSYDAVGGPEFSTTVQRTTSGHERRNENWAYPLASYRVAHNLRKEADIADFIAFFLARRGRVNTFLFYDWTDFSAPAQPIGIGDDIATEFTLRRTYADAAGTFVRPISDIIPDSVTVFADGEEVTSGWSRDGTVITFSTAPVLGTVITADFEFYVRVRFDTDAMRLNYEDFDTYSWKGIDIVEVRT